MTEQSNIPKAGAAQAVESAEVELPDVEDMAHSALQEALSCGVNHDVFHRWMRDVMDKTVAAMRAPQAASMQASEPIAEIVSASHDTAEYGERAINFLRDFQHLEYGTLLYAHPAPAEEDGRALDSIRLDAVADAAKAENYVFAKAMASFRDQGDGESTGDYIRASIDAAIATQAAQGGENHG